MCEYFWGVTPGSRSEGQGAMQERKESQYMNMFIKLAVVKGNWLLEFMVPSKKSYEMYGGGKKEK